ncbi:MAG: methylmalonyl-CoA epimerase [Deltaproteobacteria bacterium]|nr:MAG: methylmalonyl-CoA epimerase [Deltaproteobacteria bacterium]
MMELKKIDHIGIAVSDLDSAKRFYTSALGLKVEREETLQGMRIAFIPVGGVNLELIQSDTEEGVIAKFIAKRGEGVHHIAYEVADVSAALDELKAQGVKLVDEVPRAGAHGTEVAFVHPKSSYGVLSELVGRKQGG